MRTEKQREAARLNGAKSRGPVTPEGKAVSARNSLRHGKYTLPKSPEAEAALIELHNLLNAHPAPNNPAPDSTPLQLEAFLAAAHAHAHRQHLIMLAFETDLLRRETERQRDLFYSRNEPGAPSEPDPFVLHFKGLTRLAKETGLPQFLRRIEDALVTSALRAFERLVAFQAMFPATETPHTDSERTRETTEETAVFAAGSSIPLIHPANKINLLNQSTPPDNGYGVPSTYE